jgi:O-antigen ligase
MPIRSLTFLLYFGSSCAGALVVPMAGVLCYLVLYHVYPQTTWWGMRLEFLGIRYSFICGLCLMIGTALNLNRLRFGKKFLQPVEWSILGVFLAISLSAVLTTEWIDKSEMVLDKMFKVFLFCLMMSHVVVSKKRIWYLTLFFMLMALYLGHEARNAPLSAFEQNRLNGIGGPDFRESAALAIHLFALLPFVAVVFRQKSLSLKVLSFLAAGYALNAILLCRARSAFLAGIVAGLMALWYIPRKHRRWATCMLALGLCGGVMLSDSYFRERMATIFSSAEERDKSAGSRLIIWSAAWEMFKDYPQGVGIGRFEYEIGQYAPEALPRQSNRRDAHNTYVLCAGETGIIGLAAFLTTLGLAWWTLGYAHRNVRRHLDDSDLFELIIFANRLALLVYMIAGCFVSRFYTEGMWIFIIMPACIARAVNNEIRDTADEEIVLQIPQGQSLADIKPLLTT